MSEKIAGGWRTVNVKVLGTPSSRVVSGCDPKKAVDNKPEAASLVILYRPNGRTSADTRTNALQMKRERQHSDADTGRCQGTGHNGVDVAT